MAVSIKTRPIAVVVNDNGRYGSVAVPEKAFNCET